MVNKQIYCTLLFILRSHFIYLSEYCSDIFLFISVVCLCLVYRWLLVSLLKLSSYEEIFRYDLVSHFVIFVVKLKKSFPVDLSAYC